MSSKPEAKHEPLTNAELVILANREYDVEHIGERAAATIRELKKELAMAALSNPCPNCLDADSLKAEIRELRAGLTQHLKYLDAIEVEAKVFIADNAKLLAALVLIERTYWTGGESDADKVSELKSIARNVVYEARSPKPEAEPDHESRTTNPPSVAEPAGPPDPAVNFPSPGVCCFCGEPIIFKGFTTRSKKTVGHGGRCGCGRWEWTDAAEPAGEWHTCNRGHSDVKWRGDGQCPICQMGEAISEHEAAAEPAAWICSWCRVLNVSANEVCKHCDHPKAAAGSPGPEADLTLCVYCGSCGKVFDAQEERDDDVCPGCSCEGCLSERFTRGTLIAEVTEEDLPEATQPEAVRLKVAITDLLNTTVSDMISGSSSRSLAIPASKIIELRSAFGQQPAGSRNRRTAPYGAARCPPHSEIRNPQSEEPEATQPEAPAKEKT